jgi:hypothetical protein
MYTGVDLGRYSVDDARLCEIVLGFSRKRVGGGGVHGREAGGKDESTRFSSCEKEHFEVVFPIRHAKT